MGCNIHLVVERRYKQEVKNKKCNWRLCDIKEITDRNYGMYARMANVRNYPNVEHYKPRGLPDDISRSAMLECFVIEITPQYIIDEVGDKTELLDYFDNYIEREMAQKWVDDGDVNFLYFRGTEIPSHLTNPDYHSHSWLTTQELRKCFNDTFIDENGDYKDNDYAVWLGLVSYMEGIESDGLHECRCVFAFDN